MANPAYAALFNPGAAAGQAVARLREIAVSLSAEGQRGKDPSFDEWVTIVDIDRAQPDTPPPGRIAPLLRASGRVTSRAAQILDKALAGNPLTTGEWQSLDTAVAVIRSARDLIRAWAKKVIDPDVDTDAWLAMLHTANGALSDAMSGMLDSGDVTAIADAEDDIADIAHDLENPPPAAFTPLFTRIDAMRWSRWLSQAHADIHLTRREFLADAETLNWGVDSRIAPIALDSDGRAVIDITNVDPALYASTWDVESLAERLAAGVEVAL